ncbi:MAG: CRISPR-associated protein Cas5 [Thermoprotei archaeon]
MSSIPRVFYTRISLSWGFTIRCKEVSAAQPAYPVPTPTTVVGAIGYSLARVLGLNDDAARIKYGEGYLISSSMKVFLESTITASAALIKPAHNKYSAGGISVYQEPGRVIASMYKGGGEISRIKKAKIFTDQFYKDGLGRILPVQAVGSAYGPGLIVDLLWIVDAYKLTRELGISLERFDEAARKAIYGVIRLGSKEGLVSLIKAEYYTDVLKIGPGTNFRTRFYIDTQCVDALDKEFVSEIPLPGLNYKIKKFYMASQLASRNIIIPLPENYIPPSYRLLSGCFGYSIPINNVESIVGVALS